ncbi:MAG TPA: TetR family transcriptional regulator [Pseudonocardia sp.]|jgi:AcrR family transcriptional regulator|uniref:TetR family transcriptional regulator n=1 Tax=Pseudonocardia sp. TaxID=60912 RepID=UPI002F42D8ED
MAREGLGGLTMRKVAAEVGSAPTALYHHVRNKEELLLALLADHAGRMPQPALPEEPRERILATAEAMRDGLAAWTWVVEVLVADDLVAASALWRGEHIVRAGIEYGLTAETAVHAYRIIWHYTASEIIAHGRDIRQLAGGVAFGFRAVGGAAALFGQRGVAGVG